MLLKVWLPPAHFPLNPERALSAFTTYMLREDGQHVLVYPIPNTVEIRYTAEAHINLLINTYK